MKTLFDLESSELKSGDLFEKFLSKFNEVRKEMKPRARFIQPTKARCRERFREMVKNGVTLDDMERVVRGAFADDWHVKHGWKWITPDFVLRDSVYQRYVDFEIVETKAEDSDY